MGASSSALAAVGIAPEAAKIIGDNTGSVTLAGTTQGTAATLLYDMNVVTAAGGAAGGILKNHNVGRTVKVCNTSGTNATVYPPVGGKINGLSANTGVTVAANKSAEFQCIAVASGVSSYSGNVSA